MSKVISTLIFSLLISSCYSEADYSGDGNLVDNGPRELNHRYILTLGSIDLNSPDMYRFKIGHLPVVRFSIGFSIEFETTEVETKIPYKTDQLSNAQISIKLDDQNGNSLIDAKSSLSKLTWATTIFPNKTFVYSREYSYFTPEKNKEYQLELTVISPNTVPIANNTEFIFKSGGWK